MAVCCVAKGQAGRLAYFPGESYGAFRSYAKHAAATGFWREICELRFWFLAALATAALFLATPWLYRHFELAALTYPVKGVDVSHYQGDIAWQALAADGVRFAYIKATENTHYRDARFAENWRASREAGIARGAYHFFSMCKPGAQQAANFATAVPVEAESLPHALDAEQLEPCIEGKRAADPVAEILAFLDAAEKTYGRRPLIYTTREFYETYLEQAARKGRLGKERFWLRSLHRVPLFGNQGWLFWQYHNAGSRGGIEGPVDLNAFNGSPGEFKKFGAPWQP